jgi:flagellar capping protein FliD
MLTAEEIEKWADHFDTADRIVHRKARKIPVDRWATTEEMRKFVTAYNLMTQVCERLAHENEKLMDTLIKNGMSAMSLGDDT